MALYIHVGGGQVYSLLEGAVVPEVAGFSPVKAFLVLVEALEMAYGEDLFD